MIANMPFQGGLRECILMFTGYDKTSGIADRVHISVK